MESKECKKKSKSSMVLIIIVLILAAGFGYYKFVWLENDLEKYKITESPIETKEISKYYSWGSENELRDLSEIMQSSDANLFCTYVNREDCYVEQMTEEDFVNIHATGEDYRKVAKKAVIAMNNFFNLSYNGMPNDPLGFTNGVNMFGTHKAYLSDNSVIDKRYNGSFLSYFNEHQLELSCSGTEVCKMSYVHHGEDTSMTQFDAYVILMKANVKTESSVGNLSDLDIYPPNGEEREIYVTMFVFKDIKTKAFEISDIVIF